jgi:hypothetical protein
VLSVLNDLVPGRLVLGADADQWLAHITQDSLPSAAQPRLIGCLTINDA